MPPAGAETSNADGVDVVALHVLCRLDEALRTARLPHCTRLLSPPHYDRRLPDSSPSGFICWQALPPPPWLGCHAHTAAKETQRALRSSSTTAVTTPPTVSSSTARTVHLIHLIHPASHHPARASVFRRRAASSGEHSLCRRRGDSRGVYVWRTDADRVVRSVVVQGECAGDSSLPLGIQPPKPQCNPVRNRRSGCALIHTLIRWRLSHSRRSRVGSVDHPGENASAERVPSGLLVSVRRAACTQNNHAASAPYGVVLEPAARVASPSG